MSHLYKNKYRIKSARRDGYDYTTEGWYFVTICTKNKFPYFGEIVDGKMVLNGLGDIVKSEWLKTGIIRKNVILDYFVVMPNHFHGIMQINNDMVDKNKKNDGKCEKLHNVVSTVETPRWGVSDQQCDGVNNKLRKINGVAPAGRLYGDIINNKTGWKSNSLGSIINQVKGASTKQINKNHPSHQFGWQSRFYDHIIRDEKALNKIRQYIIDNPERWAFDRNNPENDIY